jgi:fumarate hydratase subunit alpha
MPQKTISAAAVTDALQRLIEHCLVHVHGDAVARLCALQRVETGLPAFALSQLTANARVAAEDNVPACQDTGLAVVFADVGQDVHVEGDLSAAVDEGVRRAYKAAYARMSVAHPLTRVNTGDNTPAMLYARLVPGDGVTLSFLAKGAGSENMNRLFMLPPAKGRQGIIDGVVTAVREAGANPCPPILLGIGIGGDACRAAEMSKRVLLDPFTPHPDPAVAALEAEILAAVNATGVGVQGFGGAHTALAVRCDVYPCHIGSLPVFVTFQCHSARYGSVVVQGDA